jgi:hypothetical protein
MELRISLSICFLMFCFAGCNTNTNLGNKKADSLAKINKLDSLIRPEKQIEIDTALPPESYKSKGYDEIGFELMETESLGEIRIGLKANKIVELLGEPEKKSKLIMWGADGQYHQTWYYYQEGIELDIIGEVKAKKEVYMITITDPCKLKTKRRIGIGSDFKDVKHAYKKAIDPEFSGPKGIVAGTIYGGIIFNFEHKKVTEIFIGAAAE